VRKKKKFDVLTFFFYFFFSRNYGELINIAFYMIKTGETPLFFQWKEYPKPLQPCKKAKN